MLRVLYEDNHLIAVFKLAGVLVQGDETGDKCLMDEVKEYLKKKYNKPGNVFLGLLHRLDRPVSGIVLFAKTSKGASRLSEQFRNHKVEKIYHTLVEGVLEEKKGTLINYLKKDKGKNVVEVFDEPTESALKAELDYESLETRHASSLLKIILKTGRPHQIRAQFSHLGHPVVGDVKYGSKMEYKKGAVALCAINLKFKTATTNQEIDLKIKPEFN